MRSESLVESGHFRFDYFKCLRSEFAKNECRLCIDLCPEEAMVFDRKRLTLDADRCTGCAACMGVCPTQAFGSELFDPDRFVPEFAAKESAAISCKENVPCLASLSSEHYIAVALRKEEEVACDLAHCGGCGVNRDGKVLEAIERMLDEADRFLEAAGSPKRIGRLYGAGEQEADESRRALLRKLAGVVKEAGEEASMAELMTGSEERQPLKRILLKNSLKMSAEGFADDAEVKGEFSFVVGKRIDETTCNNCQECAMFCPTGAMSALQDNTGIIFQVGKCIHCGICNEVCQPRSIGNEPGFDLVNFAFDRMELLVKHTLEICEECKVAFPYKGGEKVCDRCRDFKANFSDLFTLAKDLE
jgi:Pyruvate/2-oxoacid:ferredoxin oxidoreductase delta subunit